MKSILDHPALLGWRAALALLVLAGLACGGGPPTSRWEISGLSMEPSLRAGERVTVAEVDPAGLLRGDIILYRDYNDRYRLSRLIGLPGETVAITGGQVFINGEALDESGYAASAPEYEVERITLGPDEYYVLGDNRMSSADSHTYGPLTGEAIHGRVVD
jgi:signal peptidase I